MSSNIVSSACPCFLLGLTTFQKVCSYVLLLSSINYFCNSHDAKAICVQALKLSSSQPFRGGCSGGVTAPTQTQTVVVGEEDRRGDAESRPRTGNSASRSSSRITSVFHPAPPRRAGAVVTTTSGADTRAEPRFCKNKPAPPNKSSSSTSSTSTSTAGQRNLLDKVPTTCDVTSATRAATASGRTGACPDRSAASEFLPCSGRSAEASSGSNRDSPVLERNSQRRKKHKQPQSQNQHKQENDDAPEVVDYSAHFRHARVGPILPPSDLFNFLTPWPWPQDSHTRTDASASSSDSGREAEKQKNKHDARGLQKPPQCDIDGEVVCERYIPSEQDEEMTSSCTATVFSLFWGPCHRSGHGGSGLDVYRKNMEWKQVLLHHLRDWAAICHDGKPADFYV
ncbi:unnamed protein product [Amoebophrya sp. A120]|nr:unnamed protein product [Amoebophrya sp. A120]|eukprot:GSA120T00007136001.1